MKIQIIPIEKHLIESTLHAKLVERKAEERKISDLRRRLQALITQQKPVSGVRTSQDSSS